MLLFIKHQSSLKTAYNMDFPMMCSNYVWNLIQKLTYFVSLNCTLKLHICICVYVYQIQRNKPKQHIFIFRQVVFLGSFISFMFYTFYSKHKIVIGDCTGNVFYMFQYTFQLLVPVLGGCRFRLHFFKKVTFKKKKKV